MASGDMTLLQLRTAARQRADMVGSSFVSDAELTSYINQSYFELYDLLVTLYVQNFYVQTPYSFTTTATDQFALPGDFYKLLGVDLLVSTGNYVALTQFNFGERNRNSGPGVLGTLQYRINGNNLWLAPTPAAGLTIRLWYVPRMTALSSDADIAAGVSGWLEYVIADAAIKCLQKEESDVSVLFAQKQALIKRIEGAASNRDAGAPATVRDVYNTGSDNWDGYLW